MRSKSERDQDILPVKEKKRRGGPLGADAPREEASRVKAIGAALLVRKLLHGTSNGSKGVRDRDPEGGPESRLWAADAGRGQGEPHVGERQYRDVLAVRSGAGAEASRTRTARPMEKGCRGGSALPRQEGLSATGLVSREGVMDRGIS
jgi:hypothetical protein